MQRGAPGGSSWNGHAAWAGSVMEMMVGGYGDGIRVAIDILMTLAVPFFEPPGPPWPV